MEELYDMNVTFYDDEHSNYNIKKSSMSKENILYFMADSNKSSIEVPLIDDDGEEYGTEVINKNFIKSITFEDK